MMVNLMRLQFCFCIFAAISLPGPASNLKLEKCKLGKITRKKIKIVFWKNYSTYCVSLQFSAKNENKPDMVKCAEAVKNSLLEAGADKAEIYQTEGHPVVFA